MFVLTRNMRMCVDGIMKLDQKSKVNKHGGAVDKINTSPLGSDPLYCIPSLILG